MPGSLRCTDSQEVAWTLTQYDTALVRVRVDAAAAGASAADLTLATRWRRRRYAELPRPARPRSDREAQAATAIFEIPAALVHRKDVHARVRVGTARWTLDWSALGRLGPAPDAAFAPAGDSPAAEPASSPPAVGRPALRRGHLGAPRAAVRPLDDVAPQPRWSPRSMPFHAAAHAPSPRRRPAPPAQATPRAGHGRPQPRSRPRPDGAGGVRPAADCLPPIKVDPELLELLPYEHAAPRLAMPISLAGDVLTVAVVLPGVDLSIVTDRHPRLRIQREVTGYQRIVQALREVEEMHGRGVEPGSGRRLADAVWPPGLDGAATTADPPPAARTMPAGDIPAASRDGLGVRAWLARMLLRARAAGRGWEPCDAGTRTGTDHRVWALVALLAAGGVAAIAGVLGAPAWAPALALVGLTALGVAGLELAVADGRRRASAAVGAERRRIARELHDGVAQELAFIVSQASSLARYERPPGALRSIALAGERALVDMRRSIVTLARREESTLRETITEQASQWAGRAGLKLEVEIADDVQTNPEMEHAILRIVQEAISNAVRHSCATKLVVSLTQRDGGVTVRISDDGRGFDADPSRADPERGFGLVSMAERAEACGGRLRLQSEPGGGTVVEVAFG